MFLQFVLIIIMSKNSYANSLNRDVLKYLPVKILPAFAGVFTIFLLTRTLSTFLYADYVFLMATVLLFGQLIGGWINSSVLYFYPDYVANNSIDVLKINIILLQLILFLLGSIAYIIISYLGLKNFQIVIIGLLLILSQTFLPRRLASNRQLMFPKMIMGLYSMMHCIYGCTILGLDF